MSESDNQRRGLLGLWSGVGLNVGTMIGVGVFLSAGFMADSMGPWQILLAWLVGGVLAMSGARAYAAVAAIVPGGGGEYRFLSELFHPWLGTLAGWTSMLAGFAAPVATNAQGITAFAGTLGFDLPLLGAVVIVATTLLHAFDLSLSKGAQDGLAIVKVVLVVGFIAVGLFFGSYVAPTWAPEHPPAAVGIVGNFMGQLAFVMYAYSGWNTSVYAADDFRDPERNVPRSMIIGAALVMIIYLLVNWVFVANLTPDMVQQFRGGDPDKVTFGHLVTAKLIGPAGGTVMSLLAILALASAISAMTLVGPRVYQAMARDGYLPRIFAGKADKPPLFSVLLQGAIALLIYWFEQLRDAIGNIGVILSVTAALTVATLFRVQLSRRFPRKPGAVALASATVFIVFSGWMVLHNWRWSLAVWIGGLLAATTIFYEVARVGNRRRKS